MGGRGDGRSWGGRKDGRGLGGEEGREVERKEREQKFSFFLLCEVSTGIEALV